MNDGLLDKFNNIEKIHWWWIGRRQLVKQLMDTTHPAQILDIGCGTGETMSYLNQLFPKARVYGVDTSDLAIKYSRARNHKHVQKSSATKLPFKDNMFDIVLFLDVLEHISSDLLALKEAKRVLKPGGFIIITAPALSFIWSSHDTLQGHFRRYTRRRIRNLCDRTGLHLSFISYFNFVLSFPIILVRLLSNIKPLTAFSDYDNGLNFEIAQQKLANSILTTLFVTEIKLLDNIRYPWGISVAARLVK